MIGLFPKGVVVFLVFIKTHVWVFNEVAIQAGFAAYFTPVGLVHIGAVREVSAAFTFQHQFVMVWVLFFVVNVIGAHWVAAVVAINKVVKCVFHFLL